MPKRPKEPVEPAAKAARRRARLRLGSPPAAKVIVPKKLRPPKYRKPPPSGEDLSD